MSEIKYQGKKIPVYECFEYMSGNSGLTARFINNKKINDKETNNKKTYRVLSGATDKSNELGSIWECDLSNGRKMKVLDDKECVLITRKGKAGNMIYLPAGNYTINDDAYLIYEKPNSKYKISMYWFMIAHQELVLNYSTSKFGNMTWSITKFMKEATIDIPLIEFQNEIAQKHEIIDKEKRLLIEQKEKIEKFCLEKIEGYNMKKIPLFELFEPHQGNAIFTKKNIHTKGWNGNIPVISSNTDNNGILDYIDRRYVKDKDYITIPCLTWSVDGYAGKLFARNIEENSIGFVANNHCGILYPLVDTKNLYFPYLIYALQPEFFKRTKNSANKKLGNNQMVDIMVNIPIDENGNFDLRAQIEIAKKYETINILKLNLIKKLNELIETYISIK